MTAKNQHNLSFFFFFTFIILKWSRTHGYVREIYLPLQNAEGNGIGVLKMGKGHWAGTSMMACREFR